MRILEPVVRAVGQLSFRNKLRATAVIFGVPLLVAAGLLVFALNARVTEIKQERAALSLQMPALTMLGNMYELLAVRSAMQEGAEIGDLASRQQEATLKGAQELRQRFESSDVGPSFDRNGAVFGGWDSLTRRLGEADGQALDDLIAGFRTELERMNEATGLLIDGDASSSRLLDVVTTHLPGLVETAGKSAQVGAIVLTKKSIRGSRRSELTVQRGNFDALVQWSMDAMQKVSRDHPELAARLSDSSSRLNAGFLPVQEAMTVKMLDTSDFDMAPEEFIALTQRALAEMIGIGENIAVDADGLLAARQSVLEYQRNSVVATMLIILATIIASFMAAYISIMRGLNGLSQAVNTMASGNLDVRVDVMSRDELGDVGTQFNRMAENLAQRTAELREKTNDIHSMLHEMQQGILTILPGGVIHPEYSSYLETIFETKEIAGLPALKFLFGDSTLGANDLDQIDVALSACLGEDRMNFDFNAHLLAQHIVVRLGDGEEKYLDLSWSPICSEDDIVEKILVVVRDVTELRKLAAEAEHQKHELALIGQILHVSQEKFHDFVDSARGFITENEALIKGADEAEPDLLAQLFRNMHTIKGNARTLGFLHLTNVVHEAEQAYDDLRKNSDAVFDRQRLLSQLQCVADGVSEYESLNDVKLGRKGPGRRGSAEKYYMVDRGEVDQMLVGLRAIDLHAAHSDTLAAMLMQLHDDLSLIGTETVPALIEGVVESLPSLARELGKETPEIVISDNGIHLRTQVADLMRNVFMHLFRNSLDHGIESAADRAAAGKSPVGRIDLAVDLVDDRVNFRLYDDGRGLALGYIWRKAIESGMVDGSARLQDDEIARLIFASGFSTAAQVTEVSGRGVGMDAVRKFVQREGGDIEIHFRDTRQGAEFRSFETTLWLPAKFAAQAMPKHTAESGDKKGLAIVPKRRLENVRTFPGKLVTVE